MTTTTMTTTTTTARQQHQRCGWSSTIPSCLILILSYCGVGVVSLSSIATTTTTTTAPSLLRGGRNAGGDIFLPKLTVAIAPRDIIMRNKRDADDEAEQSRTIVARILEDGDESNEDAEDDESNEEEEEDDDEQQSQDDENDDDNDDDAAAAGGGGNYYYYDDAYMNNGGDNAGSSSTGSSSNNIDNSFIQIVLSDLRERFDSDMYQFWEISPSQWDANMREDCFIMLGIVLAGMILPCIICLCCYCFCCGRRGGGGDVDELPYLLSQTTGGSATDYTDCDDDGTETDYSGISKNYTDYTNFTAFTTKSWENPFVLLKDFSRGKTTTNKIDTIRTKDEEVAAANTNTNNNNSRPITTTAGQTRPTGRRKNELTLDGDGLLSTYNPVLCDNLSPMSSNSSDDILKTRSITAKTQYSF